MLKSQLHSLEQCRCNADVIKLLFSASFQPHRSVNGLIITLLCNTCVIITRCFRLNYRALEKYYMMTVRQEVLQKAVLTAAYDKYEKKLNLYAFFKINNRTISEDLVQDTFTKTWRYLVRGGKIDLMRAFLYHILNDLIIDEYRKNKPTSLDALLEKGYEPSVDHSKRLFNILDGKVALLLIQQLPDKYQKVINMKYIQDLTLKEMSLISGQSKSTIAVQLHRGLGKLRTLYRPV